MVNSPARKERPLIHCVVQVEAPRPLRPVHLPSTCQLAAGERGCYLSDRATSSLMHVHGLPDASAKEHSQALHSARAGGGGGLRMEGCREGGRVCGGREQGGRWEGDEGDKEKRWVSQGGW